jgi:hypothetical protein
MVKVLHSEDAIRQQIGGAASIFKTPLRIVDLEAKFSPPSGAMD